MTIPFPGGLIGMREVNTAAAYGAAAAPKLNKTQPYTIHNMKKEARVTCGHCKRL